VAPLPAFAQPFSKRSLITDRSRPPSAYAAAAAAGAAVRRFTSRTASTAFGA
jgi:hypothetical protein